MAPMGRPRAQMAPRGWPKHVPLLDPTATLLRRFPAQPGREILFVVYSGRLSAKRLTSRPSARSAPRVRSAGTSRDRSSTTPQRAIVVGVAAAAAPGGDNELVQRRIASI